MSKRLFTSESVTEGHPDKIADQISDAILDSLLSQDAKSRVAVETLITTGQVHVAGEVTTDGYADVMGIVRDTVIGIGYDSSVKGFDGNSCGVSISIGQQSQDIAQGVNDAFEHRVDSAVDPLDLQGAGDQGLMFGYACDDTKELMPLPIYLAHQLAEQLTAVRKSGALAYLRPDGKTQVTIEYDGDKAVALNTVVISSQHAEDVDVAKKLTPEVIEYVINPVLSKVDRSAAYAMRWVAKNVVAAGLARRCEVQVAYAIGKAHPVGVFVETFGTETVPVAKIQNAVTTVFDLRPAAIIRDLNLLRPIYAQTAAYGHFGRELPNFTWEVTNRVDDLRAAI